MGTHFHLLVPMYQDGGYSDEEIRRQFARCYSRDRDRELDQEEIEHLRGKWSNLSEYVGEIKRRFAWYYNKFRTLDLGVSLLEGDSTQCI